MNQDTQIDVSSYIQELERAVAQKQQEAIQARALAVTLQQRVAELEAQLEPEEAESEGSDDPQS